jgi:tryptophan synthase alpha chain
LLVAPTSPHDRIKAIVEKSRGFIYLVSVTGVTGARTTVASRVEELIVEMRQETDKPIGVGFGISSPEQAKQMRDWGADAAIVGSAIVKRLAEGTPAEGLAAIEAFCAELKAVLV